jgi:hypothetical protein
MYIKYKKVFANEDMNNDRISAFNPLHMCCRVIILSDQYHLSLCGTGRKISHGRQKFIWDGNVKMDLEEIRWEEVDWIDLIQNRNKW